MAVDPITLAIVGSTVGKFVVDIVSSELQVDEIERTAERRKSLLSEMAEIERKSMRVRMENLEADLGETIAGSRAAFAANNVFGGGTVASAASTARAFGARAATIERQESTHRLRMMSLRALEIDRAAGAGIKQIRIGELGSLMSTAGSLYTNYQIAKALGDQPAGAVADG